DAFDQLVRFTRVGIEWMAVEQARRDERERSRSRSRAAADNASVAATVFVSAERVKAALAKGDSRAASDELDLLVEAVKIREEDQLSKVAVLRVLASAGGMVVVFIHEMRAALDGLRRLAR